LKQITA